MTPAEEFINAVGDMLASWNLPRATGRIYGALLLEQEPVSLDHLGTATTLSKGQTSTSARELVAWGLARTIPQPGSRRVMIEATGGLEALLESSQRRARAFVNALKQGQEWTPPASRAGHRLREVISLFDGYVKAGDHILHHTRRGEEAGSREPTLG